MDRSCMRANYIIGGNNVSALGSKYIYNEAYFHIFFSQKRSQTDQTKYKIDQPSFDNNP